MPAFSSAHSADADIRPELATLFAAASVIILLLYWTSDSPAFAAMTAPPRTIAALPTKPAPQPAEPKPARFAAAHALAHQLVVADVAPRAIEFDMAHDYVDEIALGASFHSGFVWIDGRKVSWSLRVDEIDGKLAPHPSGVYVNLPERNPEVLWPSPVCRIKCRTLREALGLGPLPAPQAPQPSMVMGFATSSAFSIDGSWGTTSTAGVIYVMPDADSR